ncbi:MAG: J domain-containing protein [Acidimicrobiia bacterium]|nr:J domain-containing protein [Acidimicrobiia bacterium]
MSSTGPNNPSGSRRPRPLSHYEVLGVARTAAYDEIRRAYLEAARRWHPDRMGSASAAEVATAETAMREVNEAWSVLGDRERRLAYDRQLWSASSPFDRQEAESGADPRALRIDPRLLDPEFLAARRDAQLNDISDRSAVAVRALPVLLVLGLLVGIFVFTAYADRGGGVSPASTVPGPSLGAGIEANDCVDIMSGPALLEVPCTATADGRVIGAHLGDGSCPVGTNRELELSNGVWVCLA